MEQKSLNQINSLYKPIALPALQTNNSLLPQQNDFISIAGSDINQTSQVYLLYEIPTDLLA